ncbi:MAG: hypothetical protein KatS3mg105_2996 [Gemmatales bacterium]|nr:MAG: hypothetical protein KatS3mg105_2996 [Gemmatales bacterium]
MYRNFRHAVALIGLLTSFALAQPQKEAGSSVAPIYSLPEDGTWAEYRFLSGDGKQGTMRTSSVGSKLVDNRPHRWIEFKMIGKGFKSRFGKFLIDEAAFQKTGPLATHVAVGYYRQGDKGPVLALKGKAIDDYFTMGIGGKLKRIQTTRVTTPAGVFDAEEFVASGKTPNGDPLEYRCWLSSKLPFGLAKFEVFRVQDGKKILAFRAEITRTGKDARSEVDHTAANLPQPGRPMP